MRGYPIIFGEGVDPDAYQYFLRAGIASGTQTPTAYDNAASFNGTNQFLSIPSNSSLQIGGQAFSFSIWFNCATTSANAPFISKVGLNSLEYQVGTAGSNLRMLIGNGSTAWIVNPIAGTFVANTWNHAVFTYNGTNATIYLNGTSVGTGTGSITTSATNQVQIGNNSPYGELMSGGLSSVGFWKKALTASEVTQLFNSGAGRTYASLDSGLLTNLISWWALNQNSVIADSHGTNTLTNNGTVTAPNIGPIVTTTQNSRQLINNFVKGIKSLGLWNQMVCWPLRSSQNASSTQTAFSLGGGGTFNAALIGNPAWTSTGIAGPGWPAAGGRYVSTTYAVPASPVSYYAAIMQTPTSVGTNSLFYATSGVNVSGRQFVLQTSGVPQTDWMYGFSGNWPPSFQSFGILRSPSGYNTYVNSKFASWRIQDASTVFVSLNNSQGSGTITGWDSSSPAGVLYPVAQSPSPVAFSCIFNTFVSNSLDSQISALYKSTLGLGLLLP